ncbi:putative polyol transporter 6 [Pseudocercospora fuligena]|uniref:Putative polyol transporter 6 n=1 Tax=Pseudocercospora fuligena TaxID=685502 RepID=A0A8H6R7P4_9PEZI|nr:putative polyol transporter 6 [Pseudocercospora fuligena]
MADLQETSGPRRRIGEEEDAESIIDDDSILDAPDHIFDDNDACLIDNPLIRLKPDEVETKCRQFVKNYGLKNQEQIFVKAGKILRDPEAWESVPSLTDEEKEALDNEVRNGFWKQPKELQVTIVTLCVAAVVQGWNQTAANGANLNWPRQLGLTVPEGCDPTGRDAWIFAIVNAAPYFAASLVGCWLSDPFNEYFLGRRPPICLSGLLILASMIGSALCNTWRQLLACRVILGIGMGLKASVVPVFAAEVAPAHVRGSLVMNWQIMDALGIFLGFTANLAVSKTGEDAWRWQTASSVLPTIVLLTLIFVCSDSPRFLMKRGPVKYAAAYKTLLGLRGHPILAAKELLYTHYQMEVEKRFVTGKKTDAEMGAHVVEVPEPVEDEKDSRFRTKIMFRSRVASGPTRSVNYWQKLGQLFSNKRIRRATTAAVVCMISQQLCGVNVLALYSSNLFCDSGSERSNNVNAGAFLTPLFLSWGVGLINFLFAFPAYWLIDRRGRRWLLLIALPFMALSMMAAAVSYAIPSGHSAHVPVIAFFTYLFMIFYSFSMGPVPFTLSAEVFPLENRVVGMSFAVFCNLFGLGLLTLFVPIITVNIGHGGLLGIFAGLNVVAFVLVFFLVRETSGATLGAGSLTFMSLEELNYVFGVSSKKHAIYQMKEVLPWIWRYYVRRDKSCPDSPPQLYSWNDARQTRKTERTD